MIQKLADLQPIILMGLLMTMYTLESFMPYLEKPVHKRSHDIQNFILTFLSILVNGLVGTGVVLVIIFTESHKLGLFNQIQLPSAIEILTSVLLLDFGSYCNHHLLHKIPILWSFHRVHHSDLNLNTSSSLRFHPFEVVYSQGLYFCIAIGLFGVSMTSFIIYGTMALILVIIQHSNIRFPDWFEKYGRYVFSTPGWHKIHHSNEQRFTDSHYGDVFTFWDRIFGTWHQIRPDEIKYGLKEFADPKKQKVGYQLRLPFIKISK
ncbi:MAG: sterol desaturase family protein [Saprospiraceae bacterium]|nr:sterol desaturase family protein [Saprospiraceae bacterium]